MKKGRARKKRVRAIPRVLGSLRMVRSLRVVDRRGFARGVSLLVLLIACCNGGSRRTDASPGATFDVRVADTQPDTQPDTHVVVGPGPCNFSPPTSCPTPKLHYGDVQPIFQKRCVPCHTGTDRLASLSTYEDIVARHKSIQHRVLRCQMPPSGAPSYPTDQERIKILTWLLCGFPR